MRWLEFRCLSFLIVVSATGQTNWVPCLCDINIETPKGNFELDQTRYDASGRLLGGVVYGNHDLTHRQIGCDATLSASVQRVISGPMEQISFKVKLSDLSPSEKTPVLITFTDKHLDLDSYRIKIASLIVRTCEESIFDLEKAAEDKRRADDRRQLLSAIAKCKALKPRLSSRKVVDLTVQETEQMGACKVLGAW